MQYISTRDKNTTYLASQAIAQGLAPDGGLMTPAYLPKLPGKSLSDLKEMSYQQRAVYIMKLFLDEFSVKELTEFAAAAYGPEKIDTPAVAPVRALDDGTFCLELWHGPHLCFQGHGPSDAAPSAHSLSGEDGGGEDGVHPGGYLRGHWEGGAGGLPGCGPHRILVFYPKDGVSAIQELQMVTQEGKNVGVCSVFGNFDDAQTGVKKLFSDEALRQELARRGYFLSSANSINWGRVLPQIVYYISAYCDLLRDEKIQPDQAVNVCVPTGNFGNILAAYYAREMGVPIDRLICASNSNNVLTDFIRTGRYDRNRAFHNTISPSMDILISSNLERLLLALTQDDEQVKDYMAQLSATGTYQVSDRVREKLQKRFAGYFCDDAETKAVIGRIYQKYDYLIDPHTAVAFDALEQYRSETGDQTPASWSPPPVPSSSATASSAPWARRKQNGLELLDELSEKTGMPAPKPLASLRDKEIRFTQTVEKDHMVDAVLGMLE